MKKRIHNCRSQKTHRISQIGFGQLQTFDMFHEQCKGKASLHLRLVAGMKTIKTCKTFSRMSRIRESRKDQISCKQAE